MCYLVCTKLFKHSVQGKTRQETQSFLALAMCNIIMTQSQSLQTIWTKCKYSINVLNSIVPTCYSVPHVAAVHSVVQILDIITNKSTVQESFDNSVTELLLQNYDSGSGSECKCRCCSYHHGMSTTNCSARVSHEHSENFLSLPIGNGLCERNQRIDNRPLTNIRELNIEIIGRSGDVPILVVFYILIMQIKVMQ